MRTKWEPAIQPAKHRRLRAENRRTVEARPTKKERTVLLSHALTLGQARSCIAALADQADSIDASSAYEHVLIELDRIHGDEGPGLYTDGIYEDRTVLLASATSAIEELEQYAVDPLTVELVVAMLDDAYALDGS